MNDFILYTEKNITGYTEQILPALFKVMTGDEQLVMNEALELSIRLGKYVDPSVYLQIIIPLLNTGGHAITQYRIGCLKVLSGLITGSPPSLIHKSALQIIATLSDKELMYNENSLMLYEVSNVNLEVCLKISEYLNIVQKNVPTQWKCDVCEVSNKSDVSKCACCETTMDDMKIQLNVIEYLMFVIAVALESVYGDEKIPGFTLMRNKCQTTLKLLLSNSKLSSMEELYDIHFDSLLQNLNENIIHWTKHSPERRVLDSLFMNSGIFIGTRLSQVLNILAKLVKSDDFDVKLGAIQIFSKLIKQGQKSMNSQNLLPNFSKQVLKEIILPCGVWRPGRKQYLIRNLAIESLLDILVIDNNINNKVGSSVVGSVCVEILNEVLEKDVLPMVLSCFDEDEMGTRIKSIKIMNVLLQSCEVIAFKAANFKTIYPELIKRLDDAQDQVRIESCQVWSTFFKATELWQKRKNEKMEIVNENEYDDIKIDDVHWQGIIKGLSIHMDDINLEIQKATKNAILSGVGIVPSEVIKEQLEIMKNRYRDPTFALEIIQKIHAA